MTDLPPAAVERAAEAYWDHDGYHYEPGEEGVAAAYRNAAEAALTAALPVIERMHRAAHAEEFAAAIEAERARFNRPSGWCEDYESGMDAAARTVRGLAAAKETTTDA